MMKRVVLVLLALGLLLYLPALKESANWVSFAGLWIEFGLWLLALSALFVASVSTKKSDVGSGVQSISASDLYVGLIPASFALLLGGYFNAPIVTLVGWAISLCSMLALSIGLTQGRLVQFSLISVFVPFSLWWFAADVQIFAQGFATYLAGAILDLGKIFFFTRGNVIGLVSTDFLEVQQCAGLKLLWPVLLATMTYCFCKNYSLLRALGTLVIAFFWVVVFQAVRIAYVAWIQDAQPEPVEVNGILLDAIGCSAMLFFSWSGSQFLSAFTGSVSEHERELSQVQAESSSAALYVTWIGLAAFLSIGAWQLNRAFREPVEDLDINQLHGAVSKLNLDGGIGDLQIKESGDLYESFNPVFRQSGVWVARQWKLEGSDLQDSTLRFRIDGIWLNPPREDWLWRWFGWKNERLVRDKLGVASWGMSRSIVEEGFVVTRNLSLLSGGLPGQPKVQISLVQEGCTSIPKERREQLLAMHSQLMQSVERQLQGLVVGVGTSQEAH